MAGKGMELPCSSSECTNSYPLICPLCSGQMEIVVSVSQAVTQYVARVGPTSNSTR